ncbi:MAG: hypothetical protein LQ338_006332 [Usnochroma carphineum]|nr:MAG: hypothetical protein LQ338_006332 [Usnochroma carphineum]
MFAPGAAQAKVTMAQLYSPMLPVDHPHAERRLGNHNADSENMRSSLRMPVAIYEDGEKRPRMHKKTKSSVSLKSLIGNDQVKLSKTPTQGAEDEVRLKRPKSSTGLSALLFRTKSPKKPKSNCKSPIKDKENRTPPHTSDIAPPPIWAQFYTQKLQEPRNTTTVPLNEVVDVEREAALYTPQEYSPSKQRNFHDYRPTLARKTDKKPRPWSEVVGSSETTGSSAKSLARDRGRSEWRETTLGQGGISAKAKVKEDRDKKNSRCPESLNILGKSGNASTRPSNNVSSVAPAKEIRGSRVMAAVAALDGTPKEVDKTTAAGSGVQILDVKAIENAFETLLEARNTPHNVRDRMRSLNTHIKVDFIKKEKFASRSVSSTESQSSKGSRDASRKRPNTGESSTSIEEAHHNKDEIGDKTEDEGSPKKRRSRPRSRTFTFSKGDSSSKKKERSKSRGRSKSRTRAPEDVDRAHTPEGRRSFSFSRTPKPAIPEDFLAYLGKTCKPQNVEVERLRTLRQLLRNETVGWVDAFVAQGGMSEIIALLHRILEVEWREEHEDTLLHGTLLCLKAMCTTSTALDQLSNVAPTLFPTLLNMLFDAQRKGPSEFTTRNVVMSLLFIHLSAASPSDYASRAKEIIQYLRDPTKPEGAQPPGFIASMHHPRPYRVWCKEIVDVTKEVSWIFLHPLNVIPYPQGESTPIYDSGARDYRTLHFPPPRPPVPASFYIGGVEWDATNYLATHLDLLNGLIACLPTLEERNAFRLELKDSGFEKCMGGSLRTCKEKLYGYVHACLTTWIRAAKADGWDEKEVRQGPRRDEVSVSPRKGKKVEEAPKLEMPKFDLGVGDRKEDGGWL